MVVCLFWLNTILKVVLFHLPPFYLEIQSITLYLVLHRSTVHWLTAWFFPTFLLLRATSFLLPLISKVLFCRLLFSTQIIASFGLSFRNQLIKPKNPSLKVTKRAVLSLVSIIHIANPLARKAGSIPIYNVCLLLGLIFF